MDEIIDGKYKIIRQLGKGSFGKVYLAEHLILSSNVVIKLSRKKVETATLKSFEGEAKISARLHHPNIVGVFDYGVVEDNRPYLVREYVEGQTLEAILKELKVNQWKLKLSESLAIAEAIAEGLTAAHEKNIIHRDLKPSNIIIPQTGDKLLYNQAKILDFGVLGKLFERDGDSAVTMAGQIFGTPYYMAPEQLLAEGQTTATDIYGLGILLYEMIYNQLPFSGDSIMALIKERLYGELNFPSDKDVPPELVDLLRQCLRVNQKDRIQAATEVIARIHDLQRLIKDVETSEIRFQTQHSNITQASAASITNYTNTLPYSNPPSNDCERAAPKKSGFNIQILIYPILGLFAVSLIALTIWFLREKGFLTLGILIGVVFVALGIAASVMVRRLVKRKQTEIGKNAQDLFFGTKSRDMMTRSLAFQVDVLIATINRLDDRILGMSLAMMVKEFEEAKEAPHRQSALMNVVQLLEKISLKLSPWYVRHDKLVAFTVALIGILSGITTITVTIINTAKGK